LDDVLVGADAAPTRQLTGEEAERLVLDLVTRHAESLLRVARRYSYCADDAQDAYQRAMEILLRHAHRHDPERAGGRLHTVVPQRFDTSLGTPEGQTTLFAMISSVSATPRVLLVVTACSWP
jgi:hypothetical protein